MAQNTFSDVVNQVQQSPQNKRTERLIDGIAQQMQHLGANRPNNSDRNSNR